MKWASSTCPKTIKLVVKKLPEREEQRFHKNPFAVILIVEVLRSCFHFFGCFLNLILWHCSVAGGSSPYSLLSFQCVRERLVLFLSSSQKPTVYLGVFSIPSQLVSLIVTNSPSTVSDQKKRKKAFGKITRFVQMLTFHIYFSPT